MPRHGSGFFACVEPLGDLGRVGQIRSAVGNSKTYNQLLLLHRKHRRQLRADSRGTHENRAILANQSDAPAIANGGHNGRIDHARRGARRVTERTGAGSERRRDDVHRNSIERPGQGHPRARRRPCQRRSITSYHALRAVGGRSPGPNCAVSGGAGGIRPRATRASA